MLHVSLQDISNKRVAYLKSEDHGGYWWIDPQYVSEVLDKSF
jgi:hypothetical protein